MPASAKASKANKNKRKTSEPAQKMTCKMACTEQQYVRTYVRKPKKPLEIMNAKARRAELSRMIDGTNYSYRSASARASKANKQRRKTNEYSSRLQQPYIRIQLSLIHI